MISRNLAERSDEIAATLEEVELTKEQIGELHARLVEQGARRVVIVPVLVSSHSGHYEQIRYLAGEVDSLSETMMHHLHMSGITRADADVPVLQLSLPSHDPDRLLQIGERLRHTYEGRPNGYETAQQFRSDVMLISESLRANKGWHAGHHYIRRLLTRIRRIAEAMLDVVHLRLHVEQAEFEHLKQSNRARADNDRIGLDRLRSRSARCDQ